MNARLAGIAEGLAIFPVKADLGRDRDALATPALGQRLSDDLLRAAEAIDRRRIDQRDATIDSRTNGTDRLRFIGTAPHPSTDRPGAERDARWLQRCTGNVDAFHAKRFVLTVHIFLLPSGF